MHGQQYVLIGVYQDHNKVKWKKVSSVWNDSCDELNLLKELIVLPLPKQHSTQGKPLALLLYFGFCCTSSADSLLNGLVGKKKYPVH
jgi:hypothetical protein